MDIFNQFELANHYYDLTDYIDNNIYKFKRNGKYLQENWAMVAGIVAGIGLLGWLITWLINKNKKGKKDNKKTIAEIKQKQNELKQAKEKEKIEYEKASEEEKIEKEAKALAYECASSDPEAVLQISSGNSSSTGGGASSTSAPATSPTSQTSSQSQSMPTKQQPVQQTPSITPKADSQNTIPKQSSQNTNMIGKDTNTKDTNTIVSETLNHLAKKQSIDTTLSAFLTRSKDQQQKVIEKTSKILKNKDSDIDKIAKKTQQLNDENKKINQSTDNVDKLVNKAINTSEQAESKIQSYMQKYDQKSIELPINNESIDFNKTINQCRVNPNDYRSDFLIDKLENFNSKMETFYNKFIKIYYGFLNFYHDILELYKEKNPNDEELYILSFTICYQLTINLLKYYSFSFNNNFDDSKLKANLTSLHNDILDKLKSKNKTYNLSNDIFGFFFAENISNNISNEMVSNEISKIQKLYEEMKNDNSSDGIYQRINNLMNNIVDMIVKGMFSIETYKNNISQYIEIENKKYNNQLEIVNELLKKRDESIVKSNNFDSLKVLQYFVYKFLAFLANVFGNVYGWAADPNVKVDNNVKHTIDISKVDQDTFLSKLKSFFNRSDLTYETIVSTDKFGIKPFIKDFDDLINSYYKYNDNIEVSNLIDSSMEYHFGYDYWDDEEIGHKWETSKITKRESKPSLYDIIIKDDFLQNIIIKDSVQLTGETASYYYFDNREIKIGKALAETNNERFTKYDLFNTEELKETSNKISDRADTFLPASNLKNIESELNKEEEKLKNNPNYNYLNPKK